MTKQILIIEDEEDILDALKISFELEGFKILKATDGETGYNFALKYKPDLIVLDIKLPKMNGYEVCRLLRENKATAKIPIIIMTILTSEMEKTDEEWAKSLNVEAFFTKPFEPIQIINKAKQILAV